jgi:tetratricopeptide (TPR) repeat protein
MSKKIRRHRRNIPFRGQSRLIKEQLDEAERLSESGRHIEAHTLLELLNRRFPNRQDILAALYNECIFMNDVRGVLRTAAKLIRFDPDDPDLTFSLAGAYMGTERPAMALRTFRRFIERWPESEQADYARDTISKLELLMNEYLSDFIVTGEDALEICEMHEQSQVLTDIGEFDEAREMINQILQRHPNFISSMNNLSLIAMIDGKLEEAIETAGRVLAQDENNYNALANIVRFLVLCGRMEEARSYADRLKAIDLQTIEIWVKKAEAFTFLGDDAAVLDVLREFEQAKVMRPPANAAPILHLAAVATMRSGNEDEAKRLWEGALEIAPGFDLARENLDDLRKPVGERHAPWPFGINEWIRHKTIDELIEKIGRAASGSEKEIDRIGQRFYQEHPEMKILIPILFERGDPAGREFAVRLTAFANSPETLAALRDFALSQHGPDQLRIQASQTAVKFGVLDPGLNRMWINGEWNDILLMGWEIHGEPLVKIHPRVRRLVESAIAAIHQGDGVEGERLIRQALEIEPDSPMILNNLGKAYEIQGRLDEAEELAHQIHDRYPDYLFGRTNLAMFLIANGELDEAEELLNPLFQRKRMHFTEYAAIAAAEIELALARRNRKAARSWFEMWEQVDPDNPNLERFRSRVTSVRKTSR